MKILVTNDDGIRSHGIVRLVQAAKKLGKVMVIAPAEECSAMSHHITLRRSMKLESFDFPAEGVRAFSLDGTPADCIRSAFLGILKEEEKPDIVFAGINNGANCGFDILYSATVGAAMEAVLYNIPAICFSQKTGGCEEVMEHYIDDLAAELSRKRLRANEVWNVNFPACPLKECRGILYDRTPAQKAFFDDLYVPVSSGDGSWDVILKTDPVVEAEDGSDIQAVVNGYISVGILKNKVLPD